MKLVFTSRNFKIHHYQIISLVYEIGGDCFDILSDDDLIELHMDNDLNDNAIIGLSLDFVEDRENDDDAEGKSDTPLQNYSRMSIPLL